MTALARQNKWMSGLRLLTAAAILLFIMVLPAFAQETEDGEETVVEQDGLVIVTGTLTFEDDSILVAGYVIAPAGAFIPADYEDGDKVIVTGVLLPDGETIQAISIELFNNGVEEECDPEIDLDCDVEEECDPAVDTDCDVEEECDPAVDTDCDVEEECDPAVDTECDEEEDDEEEVELPDAPCATAAGHVGQRIANDFGVTVEEVMALRCDGYGFGEIVLALSLANGDADKLDEILAMREDGYGWGRIKKLAWKDEDQTALVGPAGRGKGRLLDKVPREARLVREVGGGNGNGNGNGRGNNGNNGNGKGNNGNGRGNNGNNGNNGKGNGKGKP